MGNSKQTEFENLLDAYESKAKLPNWFIYSVKTLLSKNITLEDWNKVMTYLKNLASESCITLEMIKLIYTMIGGGEGEGEGIVAKNVYYNSISSNLTSSNVQAALDEVSNLLNNKTDSKSTVEQLNGLIENAKGIIKITSKDTSNYNGLEVSKDGVFVTYSDVTKHRVIDESKFLSQSELEELLK